MNGSIDVERGRPVRARRPRASPVHDIGKWRAPVRDGPIVLDGDRRPVDALCDRAFLARHALSVNARACHTERESGEAGYAEYTRERAVHISTTNGHPNF